MAIEYNNTFLNINYKPSPKSMMVAIPMNLFRVETNEFSYGLNFFQKTVLKFKAYAGMKDEAIANYIGFDPKLIHIVVAQLKAKNFINEHGSLSALGKEKLREIDSLVVDSDKKKIGYVLQYVNQDKLYQYYVNKLVPADLTEVEGNKYPQVITGTKGDGEDYTEFVFFMDELYKTKLNLPRPHERDVLQLIKNSNKKLSHQIDADVENTEKLSGQLAIRFLNEQPEQIWQCTYVYLKERDDKTYEPDWRVLDPFGFGDNERLKFYLNNPVNKKLLDSIERRFGNEKTFGGQIISEFQEHLNQVVEDKILKDFSFGLKQLDSNLQQYVQAIVKHYILQQEQNYLDLDASLVFCLNLQNALENLLKQDKEKRASAYEYVYNTFESGNLRIDSTARFNSLRYIYRRKLLSQDTYVPYNLKNAAKSIPSRATSLLSHLVSFILTFNFDNNSALFKVLEDRVDLIIDVAKLRNDKGHGQTSTENQLSPLSKEEVEKYYAFIKSIINDYIQYQ